jgi:acetyl esterase/lipase/L-ascorbate metabolism protein UlaG (beta-lactamase superfamily)
VRIVSHSASRSDLDVAASAVLNARAGCGDSGSALLKNAPPAPAVFAARKVPSDTIDAEWVATPGAGNNGVVLYLHGRRFQHDEEADVLAARLSEATGLPVLLLHYRLAPKHPYPAALDDTLAAYRMLLDQGIPAERVVIVGHSAGGTLALSAVIAMRETGMPMPMPIAVAVISPITDFTFAGESLVSNAGTDTVGIAEIRQVRDAYLAGAAPDGAPHSPLAGVCPGLPPLYMACGEFEMLRDDVTRFAERAAIAGNDVTLDLYAGMPHGFPVLRVDAAETVLAGIRDFAAAKLSGAEIDAKPRSLTVRRIGWAGYEIVSEAGTRILVDPYLAEADGTAIGLPPSPFQPADFTDADVIVVTHAGRDHRGQAIEIAQAGSATLVCGSALYKAAMVAGLPSARVCPIVSGVEFSFHDIAIKSLPARHESTMTVEGQFVADQPQSYLLTTAAGSRIFCGGDTSLSGDLQTWGELYAPSVAILGIGGLWLGRIKLTELPPADAAIAVRLLGAHTVIPMHYHPHDPAPAQLVAELAARGAAAEVAVLDIGEMWTAHRELNADVQQCVSQQFGATAGSRATR